MIRTLPKKVRPGQPIRAQDFNLLIDAVAGCLVKAGTGISALDTPTGVLVSLCAGAVDWVRGRIESTFPPTPAFPQDLQYTVTLCDNPDQVQGPFLPTIARPARGTDAKLRPAAHGDPCYALRVPDGDGTYTVYLWAMTESLAFAPCAQTPARLPSP